MINIDLSSGFLFFAGIIIASIIGIFGNEYVTMKYIDIDSSDKKKIKDMKRRTEFAFFSFLVLVAVSVIVIVILDVLNII
ncbi:hypothetical protein V7O66_08000 [Methanolobus sp. ZRKC3]|uniref:hypothetical protein n=1 Tax=Methanolobus sp. ZRKC3 TaxID=3125786 RepID=UPI00324441B8